MDNYSHTAQNPQDRLAHLSSKIEMSSRNVPANLHLLLQPELSEVMSCFEDLLYEHAQMGQWKQRQMQQAQQDRNTIDNLEEQLRSHKSSMRQMIDNSKAEKSRAEELRREREKQDKQTAQEKRALNKQTEVAQQRYEEVSRKLNRMEQELGKMRNSLRDAEDRKGGTIQVTYAQTAATPELRAELEATCPDNPANKRLNEENQDLRAMVMDVLQAIVDIMQIKREITDKNIERGNEEVLSETYKVEEVNSADRDLPWNIFKRKFSDIYTGNLLAFKSLLEQERDLMFDETEDDEIQDEFTNIPDPKTLRTLLRKYMEFVEQAQWLNQKTIEIFNEETDKENLKVN